nr:unnamed protein product [Spirometra erinaceieuropaei]
MGSPVSGLVAELVLQELEKIAILQHEPVFWRRYVDDTFIVVKKDMLQHFHSLLNAVFPDITFTREEEQEQQFPFLGVLFRRNLNGELETTVYRKATNTTQLLSFPSNHPVAQKRSCVKTLFKRVQTHCSKPKDRAGRTGRVLGSRIHEHKLDVRRGDALSQVAAHAYEMGHEFDFVATKIVVYAGNKTGRELIEAWASDENSANRFIDLAPAYRALRSHLQACDVGL